MKIKRNTITALILGCVLSANITIATANTIDQSELSGTWSTDVDSGVNATAFSNANLSALVKTDESGNEYIDYNLGSDIVSERTIDYTFDYVTEDGVTTIYIDNADGSQSEFKGYKSDVTASQDEDTGEWTYTIKSTGEEISATEYNTYYFDETEKYITIIGGVVDLNLSATATDANAVAFSITEIDGTTKATLSDKFEPDSESIQNYSEEQVETLIGYMSITASATATGGDATAVYGNIEHSYLTVTDANGTVFFKEVNGDLTLDLSATAIASYDQDYDDDGDETTDAWSSATAIGVDGDIDSSVGNSYIDITATSYGATATGISGDISIGEGDVNITAVTYDRTVNRTDGEQVTSDGGDATAISGDAIFSGTTATLKAVSASGEAVGVSGTLDISDNANVTITTSGKTAADGAIGTVTLTDSTLTVSSTTSGGDAIGLSTLNATDSDASISVNGKSSATGVTTATLKGDTSLTVYATSTTEAIGVNTLNAYLPSETTDTDDIDVKITALSSTTATGVETFGTISSNDANFDISAIASNSSDTAVTATAIKNGITLKSNVESFNGTISASASSTKAEATAIAIDGDITGNIAATIAASASSTNSDATATAIDGDIKGNIIGAISASASSEKGTAEATAIDGDITGSISGTVTATATGSTATAIDGNVSGGISGTLKATSTSTLAGDNADATVISGTVGGTISGTLIATASATGKGANATATAIEVTADSTLTFNNTTIVTIATATDGTATNNAIDASGVNLTVKGDVALSGNITAGSLALSNSTITQKGGTLDVGALDISNSSSNYSMSFDVNGDLPTFATGTSVNYSYVDITKVDSITSAASGLLTATASALVGDNSTFDDGDILFGGASVYTLLSSESLTEYDIEGANGLDYNVSLDGTDTVITVTKSTYFQDKATTGNAATLGAALDSIEATEDTEWNFNARTMKEAVDLLNLDSFVPYANSFMSQVNAQTYANLGLSTVWRMRALMDKGERTKREIAAEALRNNPAFDGEEPDPEFGFKTRRVAQFQSVNVVASQDGGTNAPDYDFISTGGTADIDFALYNNLLLGVGVGGIYNKVDGSDNAGDAESTSFVANIYAMYSVGDFDLFATLGYAHGFNESEKSTDQGKSKAEWDSDSIFHLAGLSYKIDFKNGLILRPMVMYSLVYQNNGESTSKNSTDYCTTVSSESYLNFKSYLGGEIIYSLTKKLDIVARAFWTHEFGDNSYDFTYSNSLTSPYIGSVAYSGDEADKDAFLLGLSLGYKFTNDISAYLDYNANLSGDYLGHNLNAALQVRF